MGRMGVLLMTHKLWERFKIVDDRAFLKENITAQKASKRGLLQKIKVTSGVDSRSGRVPGSQQGDPLGHSNSSQLARPSHTPPHPLSPDRQQKEGRHFDGEASTKRLSIPCSFEVHLGSECNYWQPPPALYPDPPHEYWGQATLNRAFMERLMWNPKVQKANSQNR